MLEDLRAEVLAGNLALLVGTYTITVGTGGIATGSSNGGDSYIDEPLGNDALDTLVHAVGGGGGKCDVARMAFPAK